MLKKEDFALIILRRRLFAPFAARRKTATLRRNDISQQRINACAVE